MLNVQNITYRIQGRTLLDEASFQLPQGHHAALIGRNGTGKSTLFKLILDELHTDGGSIDVPRDYKIVTVAQETPGGTQTLRDFVLKSDKKLTHLFKELETTEDGERIADIYEEIEKLDGFAAESRAAEILEGLGFSESQQNQSLDDFSGGFRMRVALAAALFQNPDLLLLDEPTNHLDLDAIEWLKDFLKNYQGSLLLISHDRDVLNASIDHIFHLHKGKIYKYAGNFDQFLKAFEEKSRNAQKINEKVEQKRQHLQKFIDRFKAKASKAAQAQSRVKALSKLQTVDVLEEEASIEFSFPDVEQIASPLVRFDKLQLGYDDRVILKGLNGGIDLDDRIALLGANGNGKSTFAKFLSGRLEPLKGEFFKSGRLRVGYFHQHQLEDLPLDETPYIMFQALLPAWNQTRVRGHLGRFGFSADRANVVIKNLSGGEKVRLVFARLCIENIHLLILDEPTNHLDIQARESLILAINEFEGAIVLIAHDWHLIQHTMDRYWIVRDGTIKPFTGTLTDYKKSFK
ncbi:MAG: putative ABC transporter ATP-binding protein YheS [Holosporales bacterium]